MMTYAWTASMGACICYYDDYTRLEQLRAERQWVRTYCRLADGAGIYRERLRPIRVLCARLVRFIPRWPKGRWKSTTA